LLDESPLKESKNNCQLSNNSIFRLNLESNNNSKNNISNDSIIYNPPNENSHNSRKKDNTNKSAFCTPSTICNYYQHSYVENSPQKSTGKKIPSEEHSNSNTSKITPIKYTKNQCQTNKELVYPLKIDSDTKETREQPVQSWNLRDITKDIKKELNLNYTNKEIEEENEPEDLFTPKSFIDRINLNFTFNKIKEKENECNSQLNTESRATEENIKTTKEKNYLSTKESCSPIQEENVPKTIIKEVREREGECSKKKTSPPLSNDFTNKINNVSNKLQSTTAHTSNLSINVTTPKNNTASLGPKNRPESTFNFDAFTRNSNMIFKKKLPEKVQKTEFLSSRTNTGSSIGKKQSMEKDKNAVVEKHASNALNSNINNNSAQSKGNSSNQSNIFSNNLSSNNNSIINNNINNKILFKNEDKSRNSNEKEKPEKSERSEKQERTERTERTEKAEKVEKQEKSEKQEKATDKNEIKSVKNNNNKSNQGSLLNQFILNLVTNNKDKNETNFKNVKISNNININNLFVSPLTNNYNHSTLSSTNINTNTNSNSVNKNQNNLNSIIKQERNEKEKSQEKKSLSKQNSNTNINKNNTSNANTNNNNLTNNINYCNSLSKGKSKIQTISRNSSKNSKTLELEISLNHNKLDKQDKQDKNPIESSKKISLIKLSPNLTDKQSPIMDKINTLKKTFKNPCNKIPLKNINNNNIVKSKQIKQKIIKNNYFSEVNNSFVKSIETLNDSASNIKVKPQNASFSKSSTTNNHLNSLNYNNVSSSKINIPNLINIDYINNSFIKNSKPNLTDRNDSVKGKDNKDIKDNKDNKDSKNNITKESNKILTPSIADAKKSSFSNANKVSSVNTVNSNSVSKLQPNKSTTNTTVLKPNNFKKIGTINSIISKKSTSPPHVENKENKNSLNSGKKNINIDSNTNFSIKKKMLDQMMSNNYNNYFSNDNSKSNSSKNKVDSKNNHVVFTKINIAAGDDDDSLQDDEY